MAAYLKKGNVYRVKDDASQYGVNYELTGCEFRIERVDEGYVFVVITFAPEGKEYLLGQGRIEDTFGLYNYVKQGAMEEINETH